jgi:hypothetical protein
LIMLSVSDVTSAKLEQGLLKTKTDTVHIEQIHGEDTEAASTDNNEAGWGFRDFLGSAKPEPEEPEPDTTEILSVSQGKEDMSTPIDALPCDIEG